MKWYAVVAILVIAGLLYFLFFNSNSISVNDVKNYPSAGTEIIAFGDSLVEGVGATEGNDFVSLLGTRLEQPIVNLGKSGDTTVKALARVEDVVDRDPKVVLLLLGGNDYLKKIPKEETFKNLGLVISAIQDTGSIVVLLGVRGGALRDTYKDDYKLLAERYQTAYVENVLDGLLGDTSLMYDPIHPNDSGYKIIADRVYPVVEPLLK